MYNQNQETTCMPLLMGYTQPCKIQIVDTPIVYDQVRQIAIINPFIMRSVGTRCLRNVAATKKVGTGKVHDQKNIIDDQKTVR